MTSSSVEFDRYFFKSKRNSPPSVPEEKNVDRPVAHIPLTDAAPNKIHDSVRDCCRIRNSFPLFVAKFNNLEKFNHNFNLISAYFLYNYVEKCSYSPSDRVCDGERLKSVKLMKIFDVIEFAGGVGQSEKHKLYCRISSDPNGFLWTCSCHVPLMNALQKNQLHKCQI